MTQSKIQNPKSKIQNPKIQNPKSKIQNPLEAKGQGTEGMQWG